MDHDIIKLTNLVSEAKKDSKKSLEKNTLIFHRVWGTLIVLLFIIYIVGILYIANSEKEPFLSLLSLIVIFSGFSIFFILKFDKTDQSTMLYSKTVESLLTTFQSTKSPYTLKQVEKIYDTYQSTRNIRFTKIQIIISSISIFLISIVISCIPKSIDFIVHRSTESEKIAFFTYFWSTVFIIFFIILLFITPISRRLFKEYNYETMEYISSVILLIPEEPKTEPENPHNNVTLNLTYQQSLWTALLNKRRR